MPIATSDDLKRIATVVRSHRAVLGWRQRELAEKAGVSTRTVEAIEAAHYRAYERTYVSIAAALGIPFAQLLGEEE